ncbi:sperm protamine P1 [Salpingoeca rosetta]|uniref:Sperm protamine P1 n=1 Tax=Salpingoeca rosetta (strain ATCC 50818 / BSB-021) TaxID=946362 RepID=F2TXA1_SALR5|nr:sperm protamine P1 [Salpingoeca rosetta]EGD76010.1 sperm protamine P1 [Salpingoeca rosetta]|eukprot:XP_004998185.1 sperm protamine P1 [Salpingoeca rosetta]
MRRAMLPILLVVVLALLTVLPVPCLVQAAVNDRTIEYRLYESTNTTCGTQKRLHVLEEGSCVPTGSVSLQFTTLSPNNDVNLQAFASATCDMSTRYANVNITNDQCVLDSTYAVDVRYITRAGCSASYGPSMLRLTYYDGFCWSSNVTATGDIVPDGTCIYSEANGYYWRVTMPVSGCAVGAPVRFQAYNDAQCIQGIGEYEVEVGQCPFSIEGSRFFLGCTCDTTIPLTSSISISRPLVGAIATAAAAVLLLL